VYATEGQRQAIAIEECPRWSAVKSRCSVGGAITDIVMKAGGTMGHVYCLEPPVLWLAAPYAHLVIESNRVEQGLPDINLRAIAIRRAIGWNNAGLSKGHCTGNYQVLRAILAILQLQRILAARIRKQPGVVRARCAVPNKQCRSGERLQIDAAVCVQA